MSLAGDYQHNWRNPEQKQHFPIISLLPVTNFQQDDDHQSFNNYTD
jgi:hypothetical protein